MNFIQRIKDDFILKSIPKDVDVYLVGGAVRDFMLGKEIFDRDLIVCDVDAKNYSLKLAEIFDATFVPLDEVNKIYRVVLPDKINYLDITNPIENSLEADLKRRDLTINSVAVNLNTYEIIDVNNGIDDFNNKIINIISEKNIIDDPLRMLRVARFYSNLGFFVSQNTKDLVKKHSVLIKNIASERVSYEIMRLFSGDYCGDALHLLDEIGLLTEIFDFVVDLKKVPKNSHHHLDLFSHSIEAVKQLNIIYDSSSDIVKEHLDGTDFGGFSRLAHLRLSAFMHDIGKFSTWTIESDGRHRFIKHDDVGSKMCVNILKKLCFSKKQIEYVSLMIKNHIYPSSVMSADIVTEKIMMRFVRKMDKNAIDVILLAMADRLSARGELITDDIVKNNIANLNKLLNFYLIVKDDLKPLPKLLDGNEVMQLLNMKPSNKLGTILSMLHEAQVSGDINSKNEAIEYIKSLKI